QIAFAVIFGIGMACYIPMMPVVLHYFFPLRYDFALSIVFQTQAIAMMIGSPIAGWMRDVLGDYNAAFYMAAAVFGASAICTFLMPIADKYFENRTVNKADEKL
ncbi:monocarboxylate transporter 12-like, partial [Saccoglossus kowalevskii]